jgi:ABC-type transport system involved in multi-copper enzyme maturation permease subunit
MTKKSRTALAIVAIEIMFAGIWMYLALNGWHHPDRVHPDFYVTLGQTMGQVMGGFLGLGVLLMFIAARNDRADAAKKSD